MEKMFTEGLAQLGLAGLVILALGLAVRFLFTKLLESFAAINTLQEKRNQEIRESVKALEANTASNEQLARAFENMTILIRERIKD